MSSTPVENRAAFIDGTKIGDCAAHQPLSGIASVDESGTVNGMSHGGYLRIMPPEIIGAGAKEG